MQIPTNRITLLLSVEQHLHSPSCPVDFGLSFGVFTGPDETKMLSLKPQERLHLKSAISFRITFEGAASDVAEILARPQKSAPIAVAERRRGSARPLLVTQGDLPF